MTSTSAINALLSKTNELHILASAKDAIALHAGILAKAVLESYDDAYQRVAVMTREVWENEHARDSYIASMKKSAWIAIGERGMVPIERAQMSYRRSTMFSPSRDTQNMPENSDWQEIHVTARFRVRFIGE